MKQFIVTTTTFNGDTPVFNKTGLDFSQRRFVEKCVKQFSRDKSPKNVAMVMWRNSQDYSGICLQAEDPIQAVKEFEDLWSGNTMYVGRKFDRQWMKNKNVEYMFDMMAEDGIWPWPNAGAVFQRKGEYLVVKELLEVA